MAGDELVVTNHIPQILAALHSALADDAAEAAEALAQAYRDNAPKATGFMASSVYVVTSKGSTYGANIVGSGPMLPSVDAPTDDQTAITAIAAEYAGYVEQGTIHAAAQPAFYPAADAAARKLADALDALEAKIAPAGIKG